MIARTVRFWVPECDSSACAELITQNCRPTARSHHKKLQNISSPAMRDVRIHTNHLCTIHNQTRQPIQRIYLARCKRTLKDLEPSRRLLVPSVMAPEPMKGQPPTAPNPYFCAKHANNKKTPTNQQNPKKKPKNAKPGPSLEPLAFPKLQNRGDQKKNDEKPPVPSSSAAKGAQNKPRSTVGRSQDEQRRNIGRAPEK